MNSFSNYGMQFDDSNFHLLFKYRARCFQLVKDIEKSMYSLDEAQKGIGGKPPNQKEIQRVIKFMIYKCVFTIIKIYFLFVSFELRSKPK
jgi:hypothetical protein